jgi:hypothetical protein
MVFAHLAGRPACSLPYLHQLPPCDYGTSYQQENRQFNHIFSTIPASWFPLSCKTGVHPTIMIVFVYSPGLSYFRISEVALSPYNVIREPAMF